MRRLTKFALLVVVVLIVLVPAAISFTVGWRPFLGPRTRELTERHFETTPARLERGSYLVNGVLGCLYCHSPRDASLPGSPPKTGLEGSGAPWYSGR